MRKNTLQKNAIWIAFAATSLIVLFFIQSGWVYFKTNDDIGMMYRIMGEWFVSTPTPFTLFMHIDWSKFLVLLYTMAPVVPWYALMLLLGVAVFNFTLLYYLLHRFGSRGGAIYLLYFISGGYLLFVEIQFTITAACWSAVGLTLLARGISVKKRRYLIVIGMLLFWLGLMIRLNAGLMMFIFAIPIFLFLGFQHRKWKGVAYGSMFVLGMVLVSFGLTMRNNYAYTEHSAWGLFLEQNKFRGEIHDWKAFTNLDASKQKEILQEIGWSQNDMALFSKWFFWDQKKFNIENYRTIVDQSSAIRVDSNSIPQLWGNSLFRPFFYSAFLSVLLVYFSSPKRRREKTLLMLSFGGFLATLLILVLFLKPAPERVSYGLMAAALLLTVAFSRPAIRLGKPIVVYFLASLALVVGVINGIDLNRKVKIVNKNRHQLTFLQEVLAEQNKPTLLIWGGRFPWKGIDPFGKNEIDKSTKALWLGALQQTPSVRKQAALLEINDPIETLFSKENVFLLLRSSDVLEEQELLNIYCQEHFNKEVSWRTVEEFGDYSLVQATKIPMKVQNTASISEAASQ